ncbi:hypothetical protein J27TS7_58010 [Paenibacillus dendritiformis]|nr:hypothetical protein J27TS7_58010 [Paenibacillus dendritiformis]
MEPFVVFIRRIQVIGEQDHRAYHGETKQGGDQIPSPEARMAFIFVGQPGTASGTITDGFTDLRPAILTFNHCWFTPGLDR